jgi:hypothetical protein
VDAARCQPSAFSTQLLNKHREMLFNFSNVIRQNFFAKCKEVTDKGSTRCSVLEIVNAFEETQDLFQAKSFVR